MSVEHDATDAWWRYIANVGVTCDKLRGLAERLEADFKAHDGGYAALAKLPMPDRAIASDQILGSAAGVARNLVEARLHEENLNRLLADGVQLAEPTDELHESSTRCDMEFVAFFRAVGSALDCAAAVTIGVARLPYSIRRASFGALLSRTPEIAAQQLAWVELMNLVAQHQDDPAGWLKWTLEMRHALMHRARFMSLMLPRPTPQPSLLLPQHIYAAVMRKRIRFDPHFRKRPWLPDMQHLADPALGLVPESVLPETAVQTIRGIFEATNRLTEGLATYLLAKWDDVDVLAIDPPESKWGIEEPPAIEFGGFAPGELPTVAAGVISPHDKERVMLATELYQAAKASGSS